MAKYIWSFLAGVIVAVMALFGLRRGERTLAEQAAEKAKSDRRRAVLEASDTVSRATEEAEGMLQDAEDLAKASTDGAVNDGDLADLINERNRRG